jgi:DNA polymerase IV
MRSRKIIHVDMDCFYAAVETKFRPELAGKPVGIGGPPNTRSVLCTANYEARKFKVRAAMPSSQAMRLCPSLILIPPSFDLYKAESRAVREIFSRFTDQIEPLSLDEAYLDVSNCSVFSGSATLIAREIRRLIYTERNLTASAGIAPNKFLAKIASDWKKPNGQFVIRPEDIAAFIPELPIEKIYGVGKVTAEKMHALGLRTCRDIQQQSLRQMLTWFGSRGPELKALAEGQDSREVAASSERKSLTVEETFAHDEPTLNGCLLRLPEIYTDWSARMQKSGLQDRISGYVVKVKYFDFKSTTHETSSTRWPEERDFEALLQTVWSKRSEPVRLVGLGVRLASSKKETDDDISQLKFAI